MIRNRIGVMLVLAMLMSTMVILPAETVSASTEEISVLFDGQPLSLEVAPQVVNGRTLVPLRAIFEALGAEVQWNSNEQSIIAIQGNTVLNLTIGRNTAFKNGTPVQLDASPQIVNGRTLVPLRFVSENLGAQVEWDGTTRQVSIAVEESGGNGQLAPSASAGLKIDPAKINSVMGNAFNQFDQLTKVDKLSPADALSRQIASLRLQPEVELVEQLPDSSNLKVRFKDGYQLIMLQGDENLMGGLTSSSSFTIPKIITSPAIITNPDIKLPYTDASPTINTPDIDIDPPELTPDIITNPDITITPEDETSEVFIPEIDPGLLPEISDVSTAMDPSVLDINRILQAEFSSQISAGRNAVILGNTNDDPNQRPDLESIVAGRLRNMGYNTAVFLNNEANLTRLSEIDTFDLGVILIIGHGAVVDNDFYFMARPWYNSPPPADSGYTGTTVFYCYNGAARQCQYTYAVGSQFAETYWTNRFPETMFVLLSCSSASRAGLNGLPAWTLNHGARAWLGWTDRVTFETGDWGTTRFFRELSDGWKTVSESIQAVDEDLNRPPILYLYYRAGDSMENIRIPHRYWDNSESGDGQDLVLAEMEKGDGQLSIKVYFSSIYSSKLFSMYFDNDNDGQLETVAECYPDYFRIDSINDGQSTLVGTGTPAINGCRYQISLPLETVGTYGRFYMYDFSNGYQRPKDRLPDNGWYTMLSR